MMAKPALPRVSKTVGADRRQITYHALRSLQARQGGIIRGSKLFPIKLEATQDEPLPELDLNLGWFAVHTEPMAEFRVEEGLREAGYATFLPNYLRTVKHARRARERRLALFPRYCFVGFNPATQPWGPAAAVEGVTRLLEMAGQPLRIPDKLISGLMVDNMLNAHDEVVVAGQKDDPPRKKASKKAKSWKGRKERARERDRRKKAKAMGEWLANAERK